ncbi:MAG: TetR-like C-terminal domain-containing protein, partial [Acetobacteraceae bacterium]
VAMEAELDGLPGNGTPADAARARLRAVGRAYLRFAREETGLFRTAFGVPGSAPAAANPETAGNSGLDPFQLLGAVLDRMVAAGVLAAARRPGAEYLAWSADHGLAMLVIEGPLRALARAQIAVIEDHLLAMVEQGL